jgi:hypothetical protein
MAISCDACGMAERPVGLTAMPDVVKSLMSRVSFSIPLLLRAANIAPSSGNTAVCPVSKNTKKTSL